MASASALEHQKLLFLVHESCSRTCPPIVSCYSNGVSIIIRLASFEIWFLKIFILKGSTPGLSWNEIRLLVQNYLLSLDLWLSLFISTARKVISSSCSPNEVVIISKCEIGVFSLEKPFRFLNVFPSRISPCTPYPLLGDTSNFSDAEHLGLDFGEGTLPFVFPRFLHLPR